MVHGTRATEIGDNLEISVHEDLIRRNAFLAFAFVAFLGVALGVSITYTGGLPSKWIFVPVAAGCFPLLVIAIGSLKKALVALLILSLFTVLDVHIGWSGKYTNIQVGLPISFRAVILFGLYCLWGLEMVRRVVTVRLFLSVTIPFALIVAWSAFSILFPPEPSWATLVEIPKAVEVFFLFLYTANMLKSSTDIRFVIICVAVTVVLSSTLAICQYVTETPFGFQFLGEEETLLQEQYPGATFSRASGFLTSANRLAALLSGVLPLLLTCGLMGTSRGLRRLCVGSFALGLIALILTFSRTAWFAFFVGAVLVAVYLMKRKNLRVASVRIVVLALAAIVLILPLSHKIYKRLAKDEYATARGRVILAQDALKIIHRYPLTGVGLGYHEFVIPEVNPDPCMDVPRRNPTKNDIEPINNAYLEVAAELGIPALALFIWILIVFLRRGIVAARSQDKNVAIFALGLLGGLAAIYVGSMFNPGNISGPRFALTSFMGGLLMACTRLRRVHVGTRKVTRRNELAQ